jgi:hypothetical protein
MLRFSLHRQNVGGGIRSKDVLIKQLKPEWWNPGLMTYCLKCKTGIPQRVGCPIRLSLSGTNIVFFFKIRPFRVEFIVKSKRKLAINTQKRGQPLNWCGALLWWLV